MLDRDKARTASGSPVEASDTNDHLGELRARRFGYLFGGPDEQWCQSESSIGVRLAITADDTTSEYGDFKGCQKYASCDLLGSVERELNTKIRWTTWSALSVEARERLAQLGCYRATRREGPLVRHSLPSRGSSGSSAEWIANPFGIRVPRDSDHVTDESDETPCPVGGCVTPEMEAAYRRSRKISPSAGTAWRHAEVCPFFFRHSSPRLDAAARNPQRFSQCYVTRPEFRSAMAQAGVVVAAPVFRALDSTPGEPSGYWYSFYSGISYIQLPTRAPSDAGWADPSLTLRWHATAGVRHRTSPLYGSPAIERLVDDIEGNSNLSSWERSTRLVSVSEGQASAFLLQWVLLMRLRAEISTGRGPEDEVARRHIDVAGELCWWPGAADDATEHLLSWLAQLGYDLDAFAGIRRDDAGRWHRCSTLLDDLRLLGLTDELGQPTERTKMAIVWLRTRLMIATMEAQQGSLEIGVADWLGSERNPLSVLLDAIDSSRVGLDDILAVGGSLLRAATRPCAEVNLYSEALNDAGAPDGAAMTVVPHALWSEGDLAERLDNYLDGPFARVCRLVPSVHILVRAHWTRGLRWLFIPLSDRADGTGEQKLHAGMILLAEDDLQSAPYRVPPNPKSNDQVLERLRPLIPVLTYLAQIEEHHVRQELIQHWEARDEARTWVADIRHFLKTVGRLAEADNTPSATYTARLLRLVGARLQGGEMTGLPLVGVPVVVDLAEAAAVVVDDFNAYYPTRRSPGTRAVLRADEDGHAMLRNLEPNYRTETTGRADDARHAVQILMHDLLAQRVKPSVSEVHLEVTASDRFVVLRTWLDDEFHDGDLGLTLRDQVLFASPPRSVASALPLERGLAHSLRTARRLGATQLRLANGTRAGLNLGFIEIKFERAPK